MKIKTEWVDFKRIKSQVGMEEILAHYGLLEKLKSKKDKLIGICPIHGGDNDKAFSVSLSKNVWYCFSKCRRGGNVIDFVAAMEKVSLRDAALKIQEWSADNCQKKVKREKKDEAINSPLTFVLKVKRDHDYFKKRRIKPQTVEYFGLGYSSKGLMKGRIAIPIHNEKGELVAYAGRSVDDEKPRYKLPPKFQKNLVVYNLNRVDKEAEELIILEGFFGVFRLWQAGFKNTVALMGSSMSEKQKELIMGRADKVALMFDGDEAGGKATADAVERLINKIYVKVIELPEGLSQPDELSEEEIRKILKYEE